MLPNWSPFPQPDETVDAPRLVPLSTASPSELRHHHPRLGVGAPARQPSWRSDGVFHKKGLTPYRPVCSCVNTVSRRGVNGVRTTLVAACEVTNGNTTKFRFPEHPSRRERDVAYRGDGRNVAGDKDPRLAVICSRSHTAHRWRNLGGDFTPLRLRHSTCLPDIQDWRTWTHRTPRAPAGD